MLKAGRRRAVPPTRPASDALLPLRRVTLADAVGRTLFAEYAAHRTTDRGGEETGWLLLGTRRGDEAVVLATLPAGLGREAGEAHVRFNSAAQAFASRVVRQGHRQLVPVGVVHTHPGSLRHPSAGDYRGDSEWVANLRGGAGVFGIGTADQREVAEEGVSWKSASNVQCLGGLAFSWYGLGVGDRKYRELDVGLTIGPDLADNLRPVWAELEAHADRLDRLARQLSRVTFAVEPGASKPALVATVPLPNEGHAVRVEMEGKTVRYRLVAPAGVLAADWTEDRVDVGLFHLLAEVAARTT